jgi:hypothetical protein
VDFATGRERLFGALGLHQAQGRWLFELQVWALSKGISAWLGNLEPYEACRVAGIVHQLRVDPQGDCIDAIVSDGTGVVTARWPIRRPTPELKAAPGRAVILEGVPVRGEAKGLILSDPTLSVAEFPEVA